jgi:uncharacterized protein (TIGR02246 family)
MSETCAAGSSFGPSVRRIRRLFHPSSHAAHGEHTLAEGRIMHPRSLVLVLAVAASCSSSPSQSRGTSDVDVAAVDAALEGYVADIRTNDAAKIASWWTEDAVYIDRAEPTINGREGMESFLKGVLGGVRITDAGVEKDDLAVSGDLAYVIGRYREVLQPREGAPVDNRGRFVFIWKRQPDGTWKIARSVGTDLATGAAAAPGVAKDSSRTRG